MRKLVGFLMLLSFLIVLPVYGQNQTEQDQEVLTAITLPPGFQITVFADQVPNARSMEWTEDGTLFVGSRDEGSVYALRDDDQDGIADSVVTIASGLNFPNGVAFIDGSLYVAEISRVLRYDDIEANLNNPPEPVVVSEDFPTEWSHGWKFIRFGPDGKLYIPVGIPCNVCERDDERFGTLMRMNPDGSELEIYASGIRNTVGFDWHPETGELWFTDNGRDDLGDDFPPDELNRITEMGAHFGFPYCNGSGVAAPDFDTRDCTTSTSPAQELGSHVAALGMRFYTGEMFPEEYQNQIFIAEHGSWASSSRVGYRITLVRLDEEENAASYETFADGWLTEDGTLMGRPADVEQLPDGSLLVSDDQAGRIYRISYVGDGTEINATEEPGS
jgi:glucose/arabinose dehydrogenase